MTGLSLSAVSALAEAPLLMAFQTADGCVSTIAAEALSISVAGDKLLAANGAESLQFNLADLQKMFFTDQPAAAQFVSADAAPSATTAYTLDGKAAGTFDSAAAALSALPAGVYMLHTADGKSFKIAVK